MSGIAVAGVRTAPSLWTDAMKTVNVPKNPCEILVKAGGDMRQAERIREIWRRSFCTASLTLTACLAADAALAAPNVDRQDSRLQVNWVSDSEGSWELVDAQNNVCVSGRMGLGDNHIDLQKVSAPTELRLRLRPADGREPEVHRIPAIRKLSPLRKPSDGTVIYQVPPRTYMARGNGQSNSGQFSDLTTERLREIRDLGAEYLWLTGALEHASRVQNDPDVVKGDAGSYYAIYDNWDVSSHSGSMADFERLIERAHGVGLRVMIDFVANHTARVHRTDVLCKQHMDFGRADRTDAFFRADNNYYYINGRSFTPPAQSDSSGADGVFDTDIFTPGVQLETPAKVTGNDIISATPIADDWFETVKLNYGWDLVNRQGHYSPRPRTWDQMLDVARYWVEKGVDGFRVDYAHAVPMGFWQFFASELKRVQPEVFLLAEAYEGDQRMMIPGFSYQAMFEAGFDSVYDSEMYWALRNQPTNTIDMRGAKPSRSPGMGRNVLDRGFLFTRYMENHDEVRVASYQFAPWIGARGDRADLGLAYTVYLGLMPGHLMLHGGQEFQEDASVAGGFGGNKGRTSIFDFLHQSQTRAWYFGQRPAWMVDYRARYRDLLALKKRPAFASRHRTQASSFVDLDAPNGHKAQAQWISSYLRFGGGEAYLVVTNGDPFGSHEATIHLTTQLNNDTLGALAAAGIRNDETRYTFREVYARKGWEPRDPAISGDGIPGWVLYRPGDVPSGLFLGSVPASTTYVFKIEAR